MTRLISSKKITDVGLCERTVRTFDFSPQERKCLWPLYKVFFPLA